MATKIKPLRKFSTGAPSTSDMEVGEIAVNTVDKKIYMRDNTGGASSIVEVANASGSNSSAADDITTGDAAVEIATTTGSITIDNQANDQDIIFKGTDNNVDITALTLDMSDSGRAIFNKSATFGDSITINGDSAGKSLIIGDEALSQSTDYVGMKTTAMTGTADYMILSGFQDANNPDSTFISAKSGSNVFIRGGGNNISHQIEVGASLAKAYGIFEVGTRIELGHASDTTLERSAAGTVQIEGNTILTTGNADTPTTVSSSAEVDHVLVNDGGVLKKAIVDNLGVTASSLAADNITTGDAAVTIATTSGNITIDADGNDTDIIFKGTDGNVGRTYLTIDGSDKGTAQFGHDIKLYDESMLLLGHNGDLKIGHDISESIISNFTEDLNLTNFANDKDVNILTDNSSGGTALYFRADGSTGEALLYHYGSEKLKTQSTGVDVTGVLTTDGITSSSTVDITGTNKLQFGDNGTYIHQSADGVLDLVADVELELNGAIVDINSTDGNVDISATNGNVTLTGAVGAMTLTNNGTGGITIDAAGSDTDIIFKGTDGSTDVTFLTFDGSADKALFEASTITFQPDGSPFAAQITNSSVGLLRDVFLSKPAGGNDVRLIFFESGGNQLIVDHTNPASGNQTITLPGVTGTVLTTGNSDTPTTTTSSSDADFVLIDDGGTMKKITPTNLGIGGGGTAADDLTAGDAAVNLTTSSGNITIDAQGSDTDIIFKGTDGSSDITALTLDMSDAGKAIFNAGAQFGGFGGSSFFSVRGTAELRTTGANILIRANSGQTRAELFFDGSEKLVTKTSGIDVTGDIKLTSTDEGASAGPILTLDRNSASPANSDVLGDIQFKGRNNAGEEVVYSSFMSKLEDVADGSEDARLIYKTMKAGALTTVLDIKAEQFKINNVSEILFGDPVSTLKFEGATGDAHEQILSIEDPTSDERLVLPNISGRIHSSSGPELIGSYGSTSAPRIFKVVVRTVTAHNQIADGSGTHPYDGDGSTNKYVIDNVIGAALELHGADDDTSNSEYIYRFDQSDSTNATHPLRFYLEADKTTAYTTGVTTNGTPGSSGAYTQIAVTKSTPKTLYYQCSSHDYMGNYVTVVNSNHFSGNEILLDADGDTKIYASTDDNLRTEVPSGGNVKFLFGGSNPVHEAHHFQSSSYTLTNFQSQTVAPTFQMRKKYGPSDTPTNGDKLGEINFRGDDSAGNQLTYVELEATATAVGNGAERAKLALQLHRNNQLVTYYTADSTSGVEQNIFGYDVKLDTGVNLVFEGASENNKETTLTVVNPTDVRTITLPDASGTVLTTGNSDTPTTTTSSSDADFVLIDDGGTMKKITPSNLGIGGGGGSSAADDLTAGDAAVNLTTTSGNITVDAQQNNSEIIFKGTVANNDVEYARFTNFSSNPIFELDDGTSIRMSNSQKTQYNTLQFTNPSSSSTITVPNSTGTLIHTGNSNTPATTTSSSDADFVLIDDGGTMKKITPTNLGIGGGGGSTVAADDISAGDSGVSISTSSGQISIIPPSGEDILLDTSGGGRIIVSSAIRPENGQSLTLDAHNNDKDIIFRGNKTGSGMVTALTLDMSADGKANFGGGASFGANKAIEFVDSNESISSDGTNLILTSGGKAFKIPTSDGSNGHFLKTDGAGNLSFDAVSGGGSSSTLVDTNGATRAEADTSGVEITGNLSLNNHNSFINLYNANSQGYRLRGRYATTGSGVDLGFEINRDNGQSILQAFSSSSTSYANQFKIMRGNLELRANNNSPASFKMFDSQDSGSPKYIEFLVPSSGVNNTTITLPTSSGTLALTSDITGGSGISTGKSIAMAMVFG